MHGMIRSQHREEVEIDRSIDRANANANASASASASAVGAAGAIYDHSIDHHQN